MSGGFTRQRARLGRRMAGGRLLLIATLLAGAAATLGLGLVGPCMTIVPSAGQMDVYIRLFEPGSLEPRTYSILGGIDALYRSSERGSTLVAGVLLGFSVVFPTLKLAAIAWGAAALHQGVRPHLAVKLTHHLGKFSMLDVLVVGLLVIGIKGLPGETKMHLRWAIWAFAASVLLGLLCSVAMHGVRPAAKPSATPPN